MTATVTRRTVRDVIDACPAGREASLAHALAPLLWKQLAWEMRLADPVQALNATRSACGIHHLPADFTGEPPMTADPTRIRALLDQGTMASMCQALDLLAKGGDFLADTPRKSVATMRAALTSWLAARPQTPAAPPPAKPSSQPAANEGPVNNPLRGPTGVVQVFVLMRTAAGLVYQFATPQQAIDHATAVPVTVAGLDDVLDYAGKRGQEAIRRIQEADAKAEAAAKAKQTPPAKPAPAPTHECPAEGTVIHHDAPAKPATPPVVLPVQQKPAEKPASTPIPAPKTWKGLLALGKDIVTQLARQHGIDGNQAWPQLCKAVWAKVKPTAATPPATKPAAGKVKGQQPAQQAEAASKPAADPVVPGCFDANGKPMHLSAVMAALAKLPPAKKVA